MRPASDMGVAVARDGPWCTLTASDRTYRFAMPDVPQVGHHPVMVGEEELEALVYLLDIDASRRLMLTVLDLADSDAEDASEATRLDLGQRLVLDVWGGEVETSEALPPLGHIRQVVLAPLDPEKKTAVAWIRVVGDRVFVQVGWRSTRASEIPDLVRRFFAYLQVFETTPEASLR